MNDPIKAKIQELCPDVMELKRGTQVYIKDTRTRFEGETVVVDYLPIEEVVWYDAGRNLNSVEKSAVKEILGSPITLAVVLRAIANYPKAPYAIKSNGSWLGKWGEYKNKYNWNLEHDNYDQQSEECKQFIGSLLGV